MKIVSACLAGIKCRYDGKSKSCQIIINLVKKGKALPVCPEILGGLSTPRTPAEKKGKIVVTKDGRDVTENYIKGAKEGLKLAKKINAKEAILKARSPSCGYGKIYDGSFSNKLILGNGVFADLLKKNGFDIKTEEDF